MVVTVAAVLGLTSTTLYAAETDLEQFQRAWDAAKKGDHDSFNKIKDGLQDYVLFPYLQYEDYRNRRSNIGADEMSAFLSAHQGWAFTNGLRTAWLNTLAKNKRWADLVKYSEGVTSTKLRCQRLRGQIILKQTDGVLSEAQELWAVGKSQPDECDPVFAWLVNSDGITQSLAWKRIHLAMAANNRSLATYLSRYVPKNQRAWVADWRKLSRAGYSRMEQMRNWPDTEITASIAAASLKRLARDDAGLAARKFQVLDGHFDWGEATSAGLLRDIALYSAVALDDDTSANMERVPGIYRDSQLLEWWSRFLLTRENWTGLIAVINQFPEDTRNDDRWRYWLAQAQIRSGEAGSSSLALADLANRASYYGFLAADELDLAYNICPVPANVEKAAIDQLAARDDFQRALELRKAQMDNWAINEWSLATSRLSIAELKVAAGLAQREGWNDRVIFALGNSGDLRIYEWRFPLIWEAPIKREAANNQLDPEWVFGTIRSESAMVETARSSANARGLMQITPATGKRVAKKHALPWSGIAQLMTAEGNLPIGTAFMRDLLDEFDQNPVLVSGAYNAGPNAVKRWLKSRPSAEAAIWIETLPYYETRDYIPRVLAFTTIYNWRMGGELKRISSRMPHIESGKIGVNSPAGVECRDSK
jgi:soluble lytic murein transglycosylase